MPVYEYQGTHYELPDGLTNEQALGKIKTHLGKQELENQNLELGKQALGVGETAMGLVAPLPSTIYGGLKGVGALLSGQGVEEANRQLEEAIKSNFGFGEYKPATEKGAKYLQKTGEALQKPIEWAGEAGEAVGGNVGRYIGELTAGTAMQFVDPLIPVTTAVGVGKGVGKVAKKYIEKAPETSKVSSAIEALDQEKPPTIPTLPEGIPRGTPIERMAQSLGAPAPETPRTAISDMTSTLLNKEEMAKAAAEQERLAAIQAQLEQRQTELELAVKRQQTLDFNASELARQEAASTISDAHKAFLAAQEDARLARESERMNQPFRQAEMFEGPDQGYGPNPYDVGGQQHWVTDENGIPIRADLSMETRNLENPLQRNLWGDELPQKHLQEAERGITQAMDITPDTPFKGDLRDQQAAALGDQAALTRVGFSKKQGGGLLFDWGKKEEAKRAAEITGLKGLFPELTKVADTPEGVIEQARVSADVPDRGIVSKTVSEFTKGFLYEKLKTDNPIIKYVYDKFSDAVDASTHRFDRLIKDSFTPLVRSLSNKEVAEIGKVMVEAMKRQKELTPDFLREHGFSDKQIEVATKMKEVHEDNLKALNASREAAGKKPIPAYEAYIAGLATGNFRKIIYKVEGENLVPVGIVGSDFRHIMNKRVEALLAQHPEWKASEERYTGIRKSKQQNTKALQDALSILSDQNPNFTEFAKALDDVMSNEVYGALGAAKHTMAKKGIFGMEGDKPWKGDYENAVDMFNAQIRYTQTMGQWAEYSKAMDDVAKVLSDPEVREKNPNAVSMAERYIDNIMGQNPTKMGRAIDDFVGTIGDAVGVGPNVAKQAMKMGRTAVNTLFFTLNHAWMMVNLGQPAMVMPEMKAFLRQRGLQVNLDPTGWTDLATKGSFSILEHKLGMPDTPFESAMWKYANQHGIDHSLLIESVNSVRGGPAYYLSKGLKLGANAVEAYPRSVVFATFSHMLKESGFGKDVEIFNVARQMTDIAMTDYRHHEQIPAMQHLGMGAEMAANLTSFKQNTLSRYALFAREMGEGHFQAFGVAMLAALTLAGVMGMPGYEELDHAVRSISAMMGKPTTLSKITLDLGDKINDKYPKVGDILNMGAGAYWGVDLHNRIGTASIMPTVSGGAGKLVDIGKAGYEAAVNPSEWNTKQLMRQAAISPLQPWMDDAWFTAKLDNGVEMPLNKQGKAQVVRNDADKLWKKLGFTGSHESKVKAQNFGVNVADKYYQEKQSKISSQLQELIASNHGNVPKDRMTALMRDYVDTQGDPNNWGKMVEKAQIAYRTSERQRRVMQNQGGSLGSAYKLQRSYTNE